MTFLALLLALLTAALVPGGFYLASLATPGHAISRRDSATPVRPLSRGIA